MKWQQDWIAICYRGWNSPQDIHVFTFYRRFFLLQFSCLKRENQCSVLLMWYRVWDIKPIFFEFYWKIKLFNPVPIGCDVVQKSWINSSLALVPSGDLLNKKNYQHRPQCNILYCPKNTNSQLKIQVRKKIKLNKLYSGKLNAISKEKKWDGKWNVNVFVRLSRFTTFCFGLLSIAVCFPRHWHSFQHFLFHYS